MWKEPFEATIKSIKIFKDKDERIACKLLLESDWSNQFAYGIPKGHEVDKSIKSGEFKKVHVSPPDSEYNIEFNASYDDERFTIEGATISEIVINENGNIDSEIYALLKISVLFVIYSRDSLIGLISKISDTVEVQFKDRQLELSGVQTK